MSTAGMRGILMKTISMKDIHLKYLVYFLILLTLSPFLWLFTKTELMGSFGSSYANISGLIGAVLMLWQVILSNRFLIGKLTPDYVYSIKLHALLGIYGFFFIMSHPVLELFSYGEKISFLFLPDFTTTNGIYIALGRSALYLYLIVWITSALIRDKIPYRFWRYLHYLSYPMLLLVFIHGALVGTLLNTYPPLRYYWIFLAAVYTIFVVLRLLYWLNSGLFSSSNASSFDHFE